VSLLIIPANNQNTCKAEIQHIEQWANCNNLKLNRPKSKKIVFRPTKPRSCRQTDLPPPIVQKNAPTLADWVVVIVRRSWRVFLNHSVQGFERVQRISVLGVSHSYIQPLNDYPHQLLAVHVFSMDCALSALFCTLCSSLLHWLRLYMLL